MKFRKYNPRSDKKAVHRIWQEVGWLQDSAKPLDLLLSSGRGQVALINNRPETLVMSHWGEIQYQSSQLKLSCITGVTTSFVARKQRFARDLTAIRIAEDAQAGAEVSILGMFEQGFYNQLGYGTGPYDNFFYFSPSTLNLKIQPGVPVRLGTKDWKRMHKARLDRKRGHGSCNLTHSNITAAEMHFEKNGFGLGYKNKKGHLTHHLWMDGLGKERGPLNIWWMSYETYDQFLELMALVRGFGEHIKQVFLIEPPEIQMQDLLIKPFHHRQLTRHTKFENVNRASAIWQARICNLSSCIKKTKLPGEPVRFNLVLDDPIDDLLPSSYKWRGVGGYYTVTLGLSSKVTKGQTAGLPTMKTTVGAFTRLWLGVAPATSLAVTDTLSAPATLLKKLNALIRLPKPKPDWMF